MAHYDMDIFCEICNRYMYSTFEMKPGDRRECAEGEGCKELTHLCTYNKECENRIECKHAKPHSPVFESDECCWTECPDPQPDTDGPVYCKPIKPPVKPVKLSEELFEI